MSDSSANRDRALSAALSQIERQFGKGSMMRLGDKELERIPSISTGSLGAGRCVGHWWPAAWPGCGNLRT